LLGGELGVTSGTIGGEISLPVTPPTGTPVSPPASAATGIYHAGPDLLMVAGSRTTIAMDANKAGFDGLFATQNKTKRGRLQLGVGAYYVRGAEGGAALASAALDGIAIRGAAGLGQYVSENHDGPNATGGALSRIVANSSGLESLLELTSIGPSIEDVMLQGQWRQAANTEGGGDATYYPAVRPNALVRVRSNPGGNTYGTGWGHYNRMTLVRGQDGFVFGDNTTANNADNTAFGFIKFEDLSGFAVRVKSEQCVNYTQQHFTLVNCAGGFCFEKGGKLNAQFFEVLGGYGGAGCVVLELGKAAVVDPPAAAYGPRENEASYTIHVSFDNYAILPGMKLLKMHPGTSDANIDIHLERLGYGIAETNYWANCVDMIEVQAGTTVNLYGGPYPPGCVKFIADSSKVGVVNFWGVRCHESYTMADCLSGSSTGNYSMEWRGCRKRYGARIADSGVTN
jgi:hypothetical protein